MTVGDKKDAPTALWDILFNWNCATNAEPGIECDGQSIYTSTWNVNGLFHQYHMMSGILLQNFTIPGAGAILDMAWDGQYFYGGEATNILYKMDFLNH